MYNAFFMDLPVFFFVFHLSLLIFNSMVLCDGFLFIMRVFHTGYFDYTVTFQILLDSYWLNTAGNKT